MAEVFGWWDWDAEAPGMVNRVTGERVIYRGRAREEVPLTDRETWLRFDYLHSDLTFPLLVHEGTDEGALYWQLDYRRSAGLWRRETGTSETHPSYGAWRRVDDCVSDALACWPSDQTASWRWATHVHFDGGWLNGSWSEGVKRAERRLVIREGLSPDDHDYTDWLFPLDAPPPSSLIFHDYRPAEPGGKMEIRDNPVLLDGLTFSDDDLRFDPMVPPDAPLTQLEGRTAYLLAQDQRRLLYPHYGNTERDRKGGHWSPLFRLLYIDGLVAVSASAVSGRPSKRGAKWTISPFGERFRLRSSRPAPAFFITSPNTSAVRQLPSRSLWLHIRWGIADGWCAWEGTAARCADWVDHLKLTRADGISLSNRGYRGGRWVPSADLVVRR